MESFQIEKDLDSVAVIGMAGRFPGARNLDEYWRNLRDGRESISFFTVEESSDYGIAPEALQNPQYVKAWSSIDDIDQFSASFFGYAPAEAKSMDPQQRIFLECAWEALENAGYDSERFQGNISVYAGASLDTYIFRVLAANQTESWKPSDFYRLRLTNRIDHLAPRVAYKLGLHGAAVTVQTSCSSSLVAIHLACQSLLTYQSDMALSGGVTINTEKNGYVYEEGMILSPDGHCRVFDARAKGTIFGSGVGVVVLKRLADALEDNDMVLAVIKGSAINNDGADKVGYVAPSVRGQSEVIALAQELAGVDPATISYVEAHGTGTPLGDPIEVAALTKAFRTRTDRVGFCALGSVKSNIGHLDAAAGIAGFLKTVLALRERQLPPSLHFETPNPEIDFASSPFYVNNKLAPWKTVKGTRRAGVSSFGIGGTNAHVILEEAPELASRTSSRTSHVLILSAKTQSALQAMCTNLAVYIEHHRELSLPDVAYTLQMGRRVFEHRLAVVGNTLNEVILSLQTVQTGTSASSLTLQRPVIFLFPEEGGQFAIQAWKLYQCEPAFRLHVDTLYNQIEHYLEWDIRSLLFTGNAPDSAMLERLAQPEYGYPALFLTQYALAHMWMDWGVQSCALIGHGCGEYVAACLAGVFSVEDALWLVSCRARLDQQYAATDRATYQLPDAVVRHIQEMDLHAPILPYVSGSVAAPIAAGQATDPNYWKARLLFAESSREGFSLPLENMTDALIVAMGGEPGAAGPFQKWLGKVSSSQFLPSLAHLPEHVDGGTCVARTLGTLWLAHVPINWEHVNASGGFRRIPLPTYPFERQRYWIDIPNAPATHKVPADVSVERDEPAPALEPEREADREAGSSSEAWSDEIEASVAAIWQHVFDIERIAPDDNFFDLGGDSVIALTLVPRLEKAFQVKVLVAAILENPTVVQLARYIEALFLKKLEALSDEDAEGLKQSL